jgi:hypothetical protein
MRFDRARSARTAATTAGTLAFLFIAIACGMGESSPFTTNPPRSASTGTASFGQYPEFRDSTSGLTVIFGTPDLGVGENRVAFAVTDQTGILRLPIVSLATYFAPSVSNDARQEPVQTVTARFHEFPLGTRGSYIAGVNLDRAGLWDFVVAFPRPDGSRA